MKKSLIVLCLCLCGYCLCDIIFTDIDGVLNSKTNGNMLPKDPNEYDIDEDNFNELIRLSDLVQADVIIIHSGWNRYTNDTATFGGIQYNSLIPKLTNLLEKSHIKYGITKHIPGAGKAAEILEYIDANKLEAKTYLVLDDDITKRNHWELFQTNALHIVFYPVDKRYGLMPDDVSEIYRKLNTRIRKYANE